MKEQYLHSYKKCNFKKVVECLKQWGIREFMKSAKEGDGVQNKKFYIKAFFIQCFKTMYTIYF